MKKKTDESIFLPKGKDVKIAGEKFNIKPFVISTRIKVLNIFADVMAKMSRDGETLDKGSIASILIREAGEKIVGLYEIVLERDTEWITTRMTMKDELAVIEAVMEVNDIPFLIKGAKKLIKEK